MKLYVWPDGTINDFIPPYMSDDCFTVETDNWPELESNINKHFGNTERSINIIIECEYWSEANED